MSSSESYYIEILNNIIVYMYRYGNPIIYIVGIVGNLLSALVFFKRSWRKNVCVFYFTVCLFINLTSLNSNMIASMFITGFNINLQNSSVILCKLFFYVSFVTSILSPNILILASIDRLLISSQNVDTRLYSSKRLAYFSISISTFFWIVFNFHILIKVNIQQFGVSDFVCYYDLSNFYTNFVSYSTLFITILYYLLMIILIILAFKNVRQIKIIPRQQRNQIRSMTKKDFQLLRCLFVQDIVYIFLSFFVTANSTYTTVMKNQIQTSLEQTINSFLTKFFTWLYFIFYCSNFFIFISVSKAFRNELKRIIYKLCGKQIIIIRDDENNQNNMELNVAVVKNMTSRN
jgi:hypothetical protein